MQLIQVINRQPGSICWAAFLKLAALLAKPPTIIYLLIDNQLRIRRPLVAGM